jgi:hypothetical protein
MRVHLIPKAHDAALHGWLCSCSSYFTNRR